jgi:hypothetical protein
VPDEIGGLLDETRRRPAALYEMAGDEMAGRELAQRRILLVRERRRLIVQRAARVEPAAGRRSGKHALERRAIRRLAVRGQHELDRQVEQRTEPPDDIVARHMLAAAELDVQSLAEVGE